MLPRRPIATLIVLTVLAFLATGCRRAREGVREWTPDDHDRTDEPAGNVRPARVAPAASARGASPAGSAAASPAAGAAGDVSTLVDVTWRTQCALCHGLSGKGDGPQGPMLHASDLTRADWQSQTSDEQMAQSITQGKNRMPRFDLPPEVVRGLVKRIRSMGGH